MDIATWSFLKLAAAAVFVYVLVYAILLKLKILGDNKGMSAVLALITAVIVSFSGVVTYSLSYAVNWFTILLFTFFLIMVILLFLGVKAEEIAKFASDNRKVLLGVFILLFSVILIKSFFAMNNSFDTSNPQADAYKINTEFNTGVDDTVPKGTSDKFFSYFSNIDKDLIAVVLFLIILGIFVALVGRK
jgi:hypothetical protein